MKESDFTFGIRNPCLCMIRKDDMRGDRSSWDRDFRVTSSQCSGVFEPPRIDKWIICLMLLMYCFMRILLRQPSGVYGSGVVPSCA